MAMMFLGAAKHSGGNECFGTCTEVAIVDVVRRVLESVDKGLDPQASLIADDEVEACSLPIPTGSGTQQAHGLANLTLLVTTRVIA
jgi:hypothetical protein